MQPFNYLAADLSETWLVRTLPRATTLLSHVLFLFYAMCFDVDSFSCLPCFSISISHLLLCLFSLVHIYVLMPIPTAKSTDLIILIKYLAIAQYIVVYYIYIVSASLVCHVSPLKLVLITTRSFHIKHGSTPSTR